MVLNLEVTQRAVGLLEQIHKEMDYLEVNLRYLLGGPLCLSGCGDCCKQSFVLPAISAVYIMANIKKQPVATQRLLTDRIERWMLHELPDLRLHFSEDGQGEADLRDKEYMRVARLWCPFLGEKGSCLIYPWRDINCRAWGVTRPSAELCRRPFYDCEDEVNKVRLYIGREDERVRGIQYQIAMLKGLLETHQPSLLQIGWMPAVLYQVLEPQRWEEMLTRVPQIKVSAFATEFTWLLTLEDVQIHGRKEDVSLELSIPI